MVPLLIRFVNRFRPREGWTYFFLILAALLCPPAALAEANGRLDIVGLLILTTLAAIIGLRLARSQISARGATALGGLMGIILVTIAVGRLLPPPSHLWQEIGYTADWLSQWQAGVIGWPLPFSSTIGFSWQQLNGLGLRLWWWSQTVASGGTVQDTIAFVLLAAILGWASALFATWQIYRQRRPLVGLLPSGIGVAVLAFFIGGLALFYLMTYLFCTLWLLATCHLLTHSDRWEQTGTDYPGDMGLELTLALGPWIVGLIILAAFFPVVHPRQIRDTFWRLMDGPWSAVEQASERFFGPIEHTGTGYGYGGSYAGAGGSLPHAHLLGSGPELDETIVFYVTTNDLPPPQPSPDDEGPVERETPRRYWRGLTYDTYTGRGWINSPLEPRTSPPDQPLDPYLPPGFELRQQFDLVGLEGALLHAANAPLRIDHPVQGWWRAPGDLAQVSSSADRYTVISRPPETGTADLRITSPILPPDLAERYLALPDTLPERVLDLAEQVAGEAETRYDQAHAIEFFLRTYTYTLDLPAPPNDRDVVDYFLFDLQQGYCDYYASAMVVMARAVGIPARFASGYVQGTYDHDRERWVVVEKDGHSWVEVYFDGIGWVEFEPTAGQPALTRAGSDLSGPAVPPLPARAPSQPRVPWMLLAMGGLLVLLAAVVVWIWRPRRRWASSTADLVRDRHARLADWGARLGQPIRDGQTPHEYGTALSSALQTRGQDSRWSQVRHASIEAPSEVEHLTDAFVRTQYSPEPISHRESWQIRDLWTRLRRHLWWLWLSRQ
jgi:transglutaminase-like putative cysteine protease